MNGDPELRLLRYFVAVAEERHFGRAAELLHIAQPPLSQQIRKLESHLGVELIDRSRRPIELTDAGQALYREGRIALEHGARAFAAARRAGAGHLGHLRIGALRAALDGVVPYVLREHRGAHPDVTVDLHLYRTDQQVVLLAQHRLDVGFLRGPVDDPALTVERLVDDPMVAVVPHDHALAGEEAIAAKALARQPLVLWKRSAAPTLYADIVQLFRRHEVRPHVLDEADSAQTVLALVAAGIGCTLLPRSFIALGRHGVRFLPLEPPLPHRPLALAWRSDHRSPTLEQFLLAARRAGDAYVADLRIHHPALTSA